MMTVNEVSEQLDRLVDGCGASNIIARAAMLLSRAQKAAQENSAAARIFDRIAKRISNAGIKGMPGPATGECVESCVDWLLAKVIDGLPVDQLSEEQRRARERYLEGLMDRPARDREPAASSSVLQSKLARQGAAVAKLHERLGELRRRVRSHRWRPIAELFSPGQDLRGPTGGVVIGWAPGKYVAQCQHLSGGFWTPFAPTHWKPLPLPPVMPRLAGDLPEKAKRILGEAGAAWAAARGVLKDPPAGLGDAACKYTPKE